MIQPEVVIGIGLVLVWLALIAAIVQWNHRAAENGRALDAACDAEATRRRKDGA